MPDITADNETKILFDHDDWYATQVGADNTCLLIVDKGQERQVNVAWAKWR